MSEDNLEFDAILAFRSFEKEFYKLMDKFGFPNLQTKRSILFYLMENQRAGILLAKLRTEKQIEDFDNKMLKALKANRNNKEPFTIKDLYF